MYRSFVQRHSVALLAVLTVLFSNRPPIRVEGSVTRNQGPGRGCAIALRRLVPALLLLTGSLMLAGGVYQAVAVQADRQSHPPPGQFEVVTASRSGERLAPHP